MRIESNVKRWVPMEAIGNFQCPECGTVMLISYNPHITTRISYPNYAYCPKCYKYFQEIIEQSAYV